MEEHVESSSSEPSGPAPETPARASKTGFTGRKRRLKTSRGVKVADASAKWLITVGGIGTIVSVLGVALFLFYVVLPLFLPSKIDSMRPLELGQEKLLGVGMDEYRVLGWMLQPDGHLKVFRIDDGSLRHEEELFPQRELTAASFEIRGATAAFGFSDGVVQLTDVVFDTEILDEDDLPAAVVAELDAIDEAAGARIVNYRDGVLERTPTGQFRFQRLAVDRGRALRLADGPILKLSHTIRSDGPFIAAMVGGAARTEIEVFDGDGAADAASADEPAGDPPEGADPSDEGETPNAAVESPEADAEPTTVPAGHAATDPSTSLVIVAIEEDTNFLTGEVQYEIEGPTDLPLDVDHLGPPTSLHVSGAGTELYAAWDDGWLKRYAVRDLDEAMLAESGYLLPPGGGVTLDFFEPILGGTTFLWGDSEGGVHGGFPVRIEGAEGELPMLFEHEAAEGQPLTFVRTKNLASAPSAALSMASSERSRVVLTGFADGEIRLFNMTNATQIASTRLPVDEPVLNLVMAPKEDGLMAVTARSVYLADLDPRYPEAGFSAFFRPVWYEGYAQEEHIWQSSSGTDDFEMKLGLMPLIFGTLKATFYSMLFGAPLALLAALFTSEFLHGRAKNVIKPSIEIMASLPSVVLGFMAALVFAPFIEKIVPATLASFFTIPLCFLLGAYAWQLLPQVLAIRLANWRMLFIGLTVPIGLFLASIVGPLFETWFFAGDLKQWLAWDPGDSLAERYASPLGGWMFLFVPLSALAVALLLGRLVNPRMRGISHAWDRRRYALVDLGKFLGALAAVFLLALTLSYVFAALGFDPRGGYVDTYVQRNALIVGFVMGFAIIPIIYTISEDALSTVPEHLRAASLGAGATTWQTATRIIIPTAMSGLFSALMVGLGRAVGETMIVLMAAGNTPVMELNIFEGFRTLSANIAVELPEAVKGSTHYRTLFLAALVLFVMTFVVNTVAEVIRQRFRKRAYQL
ncbi:MAG: ABC transporter permease subunit [Acidobacteriota bacterium]